MKKMRLFLLLALLLAMLMACDLSAGESSCTHTIICDNAYSETSGGKCPFFTPVGCTCTEYCW